MSSGASSNAAGSRVTFGLKHAVQAVQSEQKVLNACGACERSTTRGTSRMTEAARATGAVASQAAAVAATAKAKLMSGAIDLNEEKNADLVIARHLWQDHRLLPPVSEGRARWAKVLVMLTLYTSFIIPIRVAFGQLDDAGFSIIEVVVDGLFILDILINFRTAAFTRDYELIFEPRLIAARYMKSGWFVLDVLATLPIDWLLIGSPDLSWFRPVLQLNRLLRISRFWKHEQFVGNVERRMSTSATWMRIFLYFRALFYFAHWMGCIWWGIGYVEYQCVQANLQTIVNDNLLPGVEQLEGLLVANSSQVTIEQLGAQSELVLAATTPCGRGVPWVVRTETNDLPNAPLFQQYLTSLYWSVATIVRNPFVAPDTVYEKLFTSAVIVFGTIAFALIIGNVNAMVRSYDEASAARRRRLASIRVFMAFHNLPRGLQAKMISYAEGDWQMTAGITIDKAVGRLPAVLRSHVLLRIHSDLRYECPLLQGLPYECVSLLVAQLQPQLCLQGEPLIEPGQLLWELFMLRRGTLSIRRAHADTLVRQATNAANATWDKKKGHVTQPANGAKKIRRGAQQDGSLFYRILDKPGQYVGLVHPFEKPPRALFRVSAVKQCQLLRVTQSTLWQVLSHFGAEVQERFCEALRDHYDATLVALKLPAASRAAEHEPGGGAFRKSYGGGYAVEEILEKRSNTVKGGAARTGVDGVSVLQKQADIDEATTRIDDMRVTLVDCEKRAAALQSNVASLPALCESLMRVQSVLTNRVHQGRLPKLPPGLMAPLRSAEDEDPEEQEEEDEQVVDRPAPRQSYARRASKFVPSFAGGSKILRKAASSPSGECSTNPVVV